MIPALAEAWSQREGPIVLVTVDPKGLPNAIYATCVGIHGADRFVVADNYFDKTRANIKASSRASLLFITQDKKSFQIKGSVEYHTSGEIFDAMKGWNPEKHPGHAAAAIRVEEAYSGAKRLL